MNGQWAGNFEGTSSGHLTLNLEKNANGYFGQAIVIDDIPGHPSFTARVTLTLNNNIIVKGTLSSFLFISPTTLLPEPWERLKNSFKPDIITPTSGTITGRLENNDRLQGKWQTNINCSSSNLI